MLAPPALLVSLRNISLRHISVHRQLHPRTSVYFHQRRFHRATVDQFVRRGESGRENRGFQKSGLWENYQLRTNRCVMTFCSFQRAVSFFSTVEILEKNPSVAEAAVDGLLLIQRRPLASPLTTLLLVLLSHEFI